MCGDEAAAARSMLQITYPVRTPKKLQCQSSDSKGNNVLIGTFADGKWHHQAMG